VFASKKIRGVPDALSDSRIQRAIPLPSKYTET